jgi:acyl-CoA thioester hydrolase
MVNLAEPVELFNFTALGEWVDFNGHMNVAYYVANYDHAVDVFLNMHGIGEDYCKSQQKSVFALENHIHYLREVNPGDNLYIDMQMLGIDHKRTHFFMRMFNRDTATKVSTSELMCIHVDMITRRSSPFPEAAFNKLETLLGQHQALDVPAEVGHVIGIRKKG